MNRSVRKLFWLLTLPVYLTGCGGQVPENLGVENGRFSPCPDSPNCVSTQSKNPDQKIAGLKYRGTATQSKARLVGIVESMNGSKVVKDDSNYLHVEFKIPIMGFIDDVEFFLDNRTKVIHMRSASRKGHRDFGVNRRRMNSVTERWSKVSSKDQPK